MPCAASILGTSIQLLHPEQHLPNILPVVDELMRLRSLIQQKFLGDDRLDLASGIHAENLFEFPSHYHWVRLQQSQINAANGNVVAQKLQGMKPRHLQQSCKPAQP